MPSNSLGSEAATPEREAPVGTSTPLSSTLPAPQAAPPSELEAVAEADRPLLHLAEAYRRTRAAKGKWWPLRRASVAPKLEEYMGATHYRSGLPLPVALRCAVSKNFLSVARTAGRAFFASFFRVFLLSFAFFYALGLGGLAYGHCIDKNDAAWNTLFWRCSAASSALVAAPIAVALPLSYLQYRPHGFRPSPWESDARRDFVDALYLLYCEHKCTQGSHDEIVHKLHVQEGRTQHLFTAFGDGTVSHVETQDD